MIMSLLMQLRKGWSPLPSEVHDVNGSANAAYIPFQVVEHVGTSQGTSQGTSNHRNEDDQSGLLELQEDGWDEMLDAFQCVRIWSASWRPPNGAKRTLLPLQEQR
jgi:hypothetical protein